MCGIAKWLVRRAVPGSNPAREPSLGTEQSKINSRIETVQTFTSAAAGVSARHQG
jgi:hypothetical protein